MANLKDSPTFEVHDDYYTPASAWQQISHILPTKGDKIIWEACMWGAEESKSPEYLAELGATVVYDTHMDCLEGEPYEGDWHMIVSNPPFKTELKKKILERFVELDKPFVVIMNSLNTFSKYMREIFKDKFQHLQIITPSDKIHFDKLLDSGELVKTNKCSFYCVYLCYKMNLKNEDLWLD